jgi:tetratricopeptide (TPR) repeat protein/TolB-like protein
MRKGLLLFGLLLAVGPAAAQDSTTVIAVTQFQGADAELAGAITETVTQDLAASPKLRLVERAQIKQAEEEIGLGATGLVDPKTAPQLGQMVGASHVLIGTFDLIGSVISLRARLVLVQTGEIVGGAAASVEGDIAGQRSDVFRLAHQLADRFHHGLTGEWLPVHTSLDPRVDPTSTLDPAERAITCSVSVDRGEGSTYTFGESVAVTFSSDSDGYVHLYDVDSAGKVTPLYPNRWAQAEPIVAGQTYTIPPAGARWHLSAEGTPGQETMLLLVTESPVSFDRQLGINDFVIKSVVPQLGAAGAGRWGLAQVRFYTDVPVHALPAAAGKYVYIPSTTGLSAKGLGDLAGALIEEGQQLLLTNEPLEARGKFEQAVQWEADLAPGWWGLGAACYALGQEEEARAVQGFGSNERAAGFYQETLEAFQRAHQLQPKECALLYNIGTAHLALAQLEPGREALQAFLQCETDPANELALRAQQLLQQYGPAAENRNEETPAGGQ